MARISYIQEDDHPELAGLINRIRGGRDGRLLNPYRMLLHSPDIATSWLEHIGAVRWKTELSGAVREIAIIRVGMLNNVPYVVKTHLARYAIQDGMTQEQCDTISNWEDSTAFDSAERAVLAYTDAMTRDVQVSDAVFDALGQHFSERQIVELTVLIATYNMHTRVLGALQVDPEV
ncbi:MAG: carboxymuconolactone decarboxylase family protein [Chloroflexota bacterium]